MPDADPNAARPCTLGMSSACTSAVGKKDFTWVWENVLTSNCGGSSCHMTSSTSSAKKNPYETKPLAYSSLVDRDSLVTPGVKLVVAGQLKKSYLRVMLQDMKAADFEPPTTNPAKDTGFMPQASFPLCCQKLDAIDAWITAGAAND